MKVWRHTSFTGHWAVGVAAVVVADTALQAAELLERELSQRGLSQKIKVDDFVLIPTSRPAAFVLNDGDY